MGRHSAFYNFGEEAKVRVGFWGIFEKHMMILSGGGVLIDILLLLNYKKIGEGEGGVLGSSYLNPGLAYPQSGTSSVLQSPK